MAKYRVEFEYIEVDGSKRKDKMTIPLSPQSVNRLTDKVNELVGPWIIEGEPFEGELEDYEVAILRQRPGVSYSPAWRFAVTEVK